MAFGKWFLAHARVADTAHKRITLDDKMMFFQQLSTLVSSGTPLLRAIQISAEQNQSIGMRKILQDVAAHVAAGSSVHNVLGNHRKVFKDHWIEIIGIGEVSGKMDMVLVDLNRQIRESYETGREVKGSLTYPIVLMIVAVIVVTAMLSFVVPTFANMFKEMDAELPGITQFVMNASDVVKANVLYIIAAAVALGVGSHQYMKTDSGRRNVGAIGVAIPWIGDLMIQSAMYRFASNLSLLLKSGVPMLETLSALSTVFRTSPMYCESILHAHNRVAAGKSLANSLQETGLFTSLMINMITIGEESAQLTTVMERIGPFYKQRLHASITKVTKLMEPAIIVVMGGIIAGLMLAIYIPMFEMAGSVK